jgi:hypothetical protein
MLGLFAGKTTGVVEVVSGNLGKARILRMTEELRAKTSQVMRDTAWVEREYGQEKWPAVLSKIRSCIASGENSLSRVVQLT